MFPRSICLLFALAKLVAAGDDSSLVREREDALAKALNAQDKVALSTLTDHDFHAHWRDGSVVRSFSIELGREDWIDDLIHLRIDAYDATIGNVHLLNRSHAVVTLDEFWTLRSPGGTRLEKRFLTTHFWFKVQGTWKLIGLESSPNPH